MYWLPRNRQHSLGEVVTALPHPGLRIGTVREFPYLDRHLRRAEESPPDTFADRMIRETIWCRVMPRWQRHLGGRDFRGDTGRARHVGDLPFNVFSNAISAARVSLNITRRLRAASHAGIERWFEPGRATRERALDEHAYVHRARRLLDLIGFGSQALAGARG